MSSSFVFAIAALALAAALVHAAPEADRITSLPGFTGELPSKWYSGYVPVDDTGAGFLHYYFVESENDPSSDPIVLWQNGGPGCSSSEFMFEEGGPLRFVGETDFNVAPEDAFVGNTSVPALKLNEYRWTRNASLVMLEAPLGVGFSYSTDPSDYTTNDNITAYKSFRFVKSLFTEYFPEYSSNDFYLAGESYAGIYVPTLAYEIMTNNDAGNSSINLVGFMVGNGCTGNEVGACSAQGTEISIEYLYGHNLYSKELHDAILKACPDPANPDETCMGYLYEMGTEVGDVDIYDIIWPCISGNGLAHYFTEEERLENSQRGSRIPSRLIDEVLRAGRNPRRNVGGPDECIDGIWMGRYLNIPEVREALHVKSIDEIGRWTVCTSKIDYNENTASLLPGYPELINRYRVMIFNGELDACVPVIDNEAWTSGLGFTVKNSWHQWKYQSKQWGKQTAGYATTYTNDKGGVFQFVTVLGAGHMVPQFAPPQALALFEKYMAGEVF